MNKTILTFPIQYHHLTLESIVRTYVKTYVLQFPENFFKMIFIDDSMKINDLYVNDAIISKRKIPFLLVNYTENDDPSETAGQPNFDQLLPSNYLTDLQNNYLRIYYDPIRKINIYIPFIRNSIKIQFTIGLDSREKQIDLKRWMKYNFRFGDMPIYINNFPSFTVLPNSVFELIASLCDYDLRDNDVRKSYNMLIKMNSSGLIKSRRLMMDKSVELYMLDYIMNQLYVKHENDLSSDNPNMKNMAVIDARISHSVTIEPHLPTACILEMPEIVNGKKVPNKYTPVIGDRDKLDKRLYKTIFYKTLTTPGHKVNYNIICNEEFIVDSDGEQIFNLIDLLPDTYIKCIRMILFKKLDVTQYITVEVYSNITILEENKDYVIDYDTLNIKIFNCDKRDIYRIIIRERYSALKHILEVFQGGSNDIKRV